ncbi:hypothetical protein JQN24_27720, partial [Escherichia coli]|nr:hypothetical protein [Escherichia coli]
LGIKSFFQPVASGVIIVAAVLAKNFLTPRSRQAKRSTFTPTALAFITL